MGKIQIVIPDDLKERFEKAVFDRLGMKKGNISRAAEEAIRDWIGKEVRK